MWRYLRVALAVVALTAIGAPTASADPGENNPNTATRVFSDCTNGADALEVVFAGEAGSNFLVTGNQSVFVYKRIAIDRPPLGPGGDDEIDERGLKGFSEGSLTTCTYVTASGNHVTVTGFFTPR
jgi:hypothetical protein